MESKRQKKIRKRIQASQSILIKHKDESSSFKEQLTPEDLRLHNKVAEHNSNSVEMRSFANRSYQDVNTYIANNNIKPTNRSRFTY